ncbi:MAG TPA: glycosyltransferase [Azospirillaceae bacterium]|nr:glycosyltransferase [Azospirillaceae bacterium]
MRIFNVVAGAEYGGAENFAIRLSVAFKSAGMEVGAAIRTHADRAATLRDAGVPVTELRFATPWFDLGTRFGLRRAISAFRPDVVLSFMNRASRMTPRGPYVRVGRLGGYYNLKNYGNCDHLVGITPDLCRHIRDGGWPSDRVHCIPNFAEGRPMPPLARSALGTPEGVPLLLALGRLHVNKGFDVLLKALARVPGAWLWLAGEGPERATLEGLARDLGVADRVRFLGWRTDIGALFAACDVFVVPSRHEPLGSVLVEGFFYGRPMVAAASQGPRQIVTDGVNGLLVPVDDDAAMAAALGRVLADPDLAGQLAVAGRAEYDSKYTESAVVSAYRDLFTRILDRAS